MIDLYKEPDIEDILYIWLSASEKAHSFIPSSYWKEKLKDMRTIYLPASETYVFRDKDTGKIVGFISLVEEYLAALFINNHYQHRGIGKKLLNFSKTIRDRLTLNVYEKNHSAISFYKSQGFITVCKQVEKETGQDELVMQWNAENK